MWCCAERKEFVRMEVVRTRILSYTKTVLRWKVIYSVSCSVFVRDGNYTAACASARFPFNIFSYSNYNELIITTAISYGYVDFMRCRRWLYQSSTIWRKTYANNKLVPEFWYYSIRISRIILYTFTLYVHSSYVF